MKRKERDALRLSGGEDPSRKGGALGAMLRRMGCLLTAAALLLSLGACKDKDSDGGGGSGKKSGSLERLSLEEVKADPEKAIGEQGKQGLEAVVDKLDELSSSASASGSLDLTVSMELENGQYQGRDLNDYLDGTSIGLRLDARRDHIGLEGDITVMRKPFLSGTLLYEDGVLGFQVPELDRTYYTIDLEKVLQSSSEGRQILETLERMEQMEALELPTDDILSVLERYIDVAAQTVNEDNLTAEEDTFRFDKLDADEVSGNVYTFRPTAQDIEDLLVRLADELEDDQELQDTVMELVEEFSTLAGMGVSSDQLSQMADEMAQGLREGAQEIRANAAEMGRSAAEAEPTLILCEGKEETRLALTLRDGSETYGFYLEQCPTGFAVWAEGEGMTPIELVAEYEKSGGSCSGTATLNISNGYSYDSVSLILSFEDVTRETSSLGINYGSYTLSIPQANGEVYLDVTGAGSGTDHILSWDFPALSQMYARGNMPDFNGARLTIHTSDRDVSISAPGGSSRELNVMDPYELREVFGPWEQALQQRAMDLGEELGLIRGSSVEDAPAVAPTW